MRLPRHGSCSLTSLGQIFFKFHEAMQDAQLAMTGNIGQMMSVFAPDPHTHDPALIEKMVFDTVQIFVLFCTAYLWNICKSRPLPDLCRASCAPH